MDIEDIDNQAKNDPLSKEELKKSNMSLREFLNKRRKDARKSGEVAGAVKTPKAKSVSTSKRKIPTPVKASPGADLSAPKLKSKRTDTGQRPDSRGSGKDKDLFDTPAGVTSGDDEFYKFYGKPGTTIGDFSRKFGIQYATQKGFERDFPEHDGEQMGGRPGKSKMKTQGLNRSKRTGFSGRGAGAALRGF